MDNDKPTTPRLTRTLVVVVDIAAWLSIGPFIVTILWIPFAYATNYAGPGNILLKVPVLLVVAAISGIGVSWLKRRHREKKRSVFGLATASGGTETVSAERQLDKALMKAQRRRRALFTVDVMAWFLIFCFLAALVWFEEQVNRGEGVRGKISLLSQWILLFDLAPAVFGAVWVVTRSVRRYADEKKRLEELDSTETPNLLYLVLPTLIIIISFMIVAGIAASPSGRQ